jgi:predicted nucleic acid-binding protein
VSDFVLDASLALQWLLEDETDRRYGLAVLESLSGSRGVVPILWFYETGNGLLMAHRRKRISFAQVEGFLARLKTLPIVAFHTEGLDILNLPPFAQAHGLTNYDAAYLALSMNLKIPLASADRDLRRAAEALNVPIWKAQ